MSLARESLAEADIALAPRASQSNELRVVSAPAKRRRGRPRKDGSGTTDQAAAILDAAITLFMKQGYQATTMSQIAEASGYSQSSLYYWYKKKEDLLESIVEKTGFSLRTASRIANLPDDKLTQLYAVLYADTLMMCKLPCDFYDLEDVAHTQEDTLSGFFTTYQQLTGAVRQIIEEGIESGEFIKIDAATAALDALAVNEGLQHRYHSTVRFPSSTCSMVEEEARTIFRSAEDVAHHAATITIEYLAPGCVPAKVRQQAIDNNWI
ncbi:Uncharacterized HTH-type transcriptional regulator yfiR [Slackia heliotrinireducens]|uniref:Transcriptional regulator n=1 Tax=Slackia heliotrinireducens (strain ATCC 29202 / DSM 20476 / NCTC 11029 / RHS 1) TaxID=471855 RepID=C7N8F5_SLAHD|nr:TetR/AcrR family transcriptional regulator [Slackia heliotrinireducens]ACV23190.1 transcriptional regulator [Slackia heliotrinireducens DSM 20476]VEH02275.1 Uncharacterized HTH-type transcriptional regulator yfiR [Slackia heliotrinireducens]